MDDAEVSPAIPDRVAALEERVEYLFSLISAPAIPQIPQIPQIPEDAEQLVIEELGGMMLRTEDLGRPDVTEGTAGLDERMAASSGRAKTDKPLPLSRLFRPSKVGFTAEDFKERFPDVNPNDSLEKFLNFYISRGDVAVNWFEKFIGWSHEAQRRAALAKKEHRVETDSMGLPLDPQLRRRMNGNPDDPDAAQRMAELKSKQDEIYDSLTDEEKEMLP